MDTNSFIVYIITADVYKDIAEDLETSFYTSSYELERPLPKKENEKSNWIKLLCYLQLLKNANYLQSGEDFAMERHLVI